MKYSIIIPTLNEEKLLPGLLKQLSVSEFKKKYDYEIIVSDGNSRDKTVEIARKYADIVKIHSKKTKQNIAEGRNIGSKYANGEILIFLNGDILLSHVSEFFDYIEAEFVKSKFLAMTCFVKVFKPEQKLSDKIFHFVFNNYFRIINNIGIGMGRGECHIIRKEIFSKLNGYNESLAAGEDFDLFKRIRKYGKILFADDLFVYESPRRFREMGYKYVIWVWIKNGLSIFFKDKAISKEWDQVR